MTVGIRARGAFSLVEVVLAVGIVAFAVLTTVGLLAVADETNRRSREEGFAAQLAANEFERIRTLGPTNFPAANIYNPRFFDSNLAEVSSADARAVYEMRMTIAPPPSPAPADRIFNAEVRYPAKAASPSKYLFTTLMNIPVATPTPTP